ncbi:MAG TPA: three-Cys-motif partner protein TcmP, partial [Ktedonobacterales bacterium]|nr:three-Cys-motif partner protein TcmP [Ktedonobacterales bacterium]
QVLKQYLEKLSFKVGTWASVLNYVDGFAGPWRAVTDDLSDTSPHIAIQRLRIAKAGLARRQHYPAIRCLFIEKDNEAFRRLEESVNLITDIDANVLHGEFEHAIPQVLKFARVGGTAGFTFFFIDPTGWSGFGMDAITPVLRHAPSEVLINFMTKDIKRFIDDPFSTALLKYVELFGTHDYRQQWAGLEGQDREDRIVQTYCERIRQAGNFTHVISAIVLHPTDGRTHFHLIYCTRHAEGLRTFRAIEEKTMEQQEHIRAEAQQQNRIGRTLQLDLFTSENLGAGSHYEMLRARYLATSHSALESLLKSSGMLTYEDIEQAALQMPMTWVRDIQAWVKDWQAQHLIRVDGLMPRERTLKPGKQHIVSWIGPR